MRSTEWLRWERNPRWGRDLCTQAHLQPTRSGGPSPEPVSDGPRLHLDRRQWLAGLSAAAGMLLTRPGMAGAAVPITLQTLLRQSEHVLVGTPQAAESMWEVVGDTRRIVTYTRVGVDETLDERPPKDGDMFVRTLGGAVGDIGQIVHGEAELEHGAPSVLFLRGRPDGTFRITAMAQGHYPLGLDAEGSFRLELSPRLPDFITQDHQAAVGQLRGKTLQYAHDLIRKLRHG